MEFPMMTICGSPRQGSVQGVVTHELIHMWFPMLVGSNEKAHAWQDEGITSFMTGLTRADYRQQPSPRRSGGYAALAEKVVVNLPLPNGEIQYLSVVESVTGCLGERVWARIIWGVRARVRKNTQHYRQGIQFDNISKGRIPKYCNFHRICTVCCNFYWCRTRPKI